MAAASGCGSGPGRCSTSAAGRTAPWRRPRPSGRLAGWKAAGAGGPSPSGTEIVSNKCPLLPVLPPTNEPGLVSLSSACWLSPLTLLMCTPPSCSPLNSWFGQRLDYRCRRGRQRRRQRVFPLPRARSCRVSRLLH